MTIRKMRTSDLPAVARLCGQLGYPSSLERVTQRFAVLEDRTGEHVLVAADEGAVWGWIHVRQVDSLESDPHAEIWGLVVDEAARSRGVGRALLDAAERWAIENRFPCLRLRSNVVRERAHAFYTRAGYGVVKHQVVFEMRLRADLDPETPTKPRTRSRERGA